MTDLIAHHRLDANPRRNAQGQAIGPDLPGWTARPLPPRAPMIGRTCRLEPLDPQRHAADLYAADSLDTTGESWTYMAYGPFADLDAYRTWMAGACQSGHTLFHAVIDTASGQAVGVAAYLRIDPAAGSLEVGHLHFSPRLQRTVMATEALYLMMRRAFDELGYRRYEWKCDSLNAPSRAAAARLGFTYEGTFRQATVYKGRSRDTSWFAITDGDWPALKARFERWLHPGNFDADGRQQSSL